MRASGLRFAFAAGCAGLAWLLAPAAVQAQTVDVEAVAPETGAEPFSFKAGYDHMFSSDVTGGGHVSRDAFQASIGGRFDLGGSLSLQTRFVYELNAYDLTNGAAPFQWGNVNQYTLLGLLNWQINESWSVLGGPIFRLAGEGSAAFDNGGSAGGLAGFNYRASPDLSFGLALGVFSQIEDDPGLIPIPMVRWHFAEPVSFKLGIDQLGGRTGLGPELIYHVTPEIDLGMGFQYQRRRFRLDDNGFNRKAVGEDTALPVFARLAFHPMPAATVELFGGVVAGGELQIQDKNGNNTFDRGYDPTPTLGLRGEFRF
jgi:hypothetical protein